MHLRVNLPFYWQQEEKNPRKVHVARVEVWRIADQCKGNPQRNAEQKSRVELRRSGLDVLNMGQFWRINERHLWSFSRQLSSLSEESTLTQRLGFLENFNSSINSAQLFSYLSSARSSIPLPIPDTPSSAIHWKSTMTRKASSMALLTINRKYPTEQCETVNNKIRFHFMICRHFNMK